MTTVRPTWASQMVCQTSAYLPRRVAFPLGPCRQPCNTAALSVPMRTSHVVRWRTARTASNSAS
eukprot:6491512-Amphidinium_carterae.3